MTNEELETIKSKLQGARKSLYRDEQPSIAMHDINETLAIIDNVQKRAISFGRGPDCYNCNCKTKCERYA